jgi:outer membrane protein with glycine zipper
MLKQYCTLGVAGALLLAATGCENLPGNEKSQGAVIGGASGAAVGAAVGGEGHRLLGALIGGVLGAGGGYLIGANWDKITGKDTAGATEATREAQAKPATVEDAQKATTADLNSDGFVTMDEVVAMERAGFADDKIIDRLRATGQIFELTAEQKNYLRSRGVSENVIAPKPEQPGPGDWPRSKFALVRRCLQSTPARETGRAFYLPVAAVISGCGTDPAGGEGR